MAKTYGTVTTFTAGSVLTAAQLNVASTAVNNLVVPAAVRLDKTANQLISNVADTIITWPASATFDTDSMYSSAATDRITITTAGIYVVTANITFANANAGERIVWLQKNASGTTRFGMSRGMASTGGETTISISTVLSLSVSDYLQVGCYQANGTSVNVLATGTQPTNLSATWIGRTS